MDVFSCRVRPGGHIFHEVNCDGITAAEVTALRHIHNGAESVFAFVRTGKSTVSQRDEYVRLCETYGAEKIKEIFGPLTAARLPTAIDDEFTDAVLGTPTPVAKRGRKAAQAAPVAAAAPDDDDDDDALS